MDKKSWKKLIEKQCREANTYQPYFESVIETLAQILETRDSVHEQYVKEGSHPTIVKNVERSDKTNITKNPLLLLEQDLNTQALAYWRECGLTPKGLRTLNAEVKEMSNSGLEKLLAKLDG